MCDDIPNTAEQKARKAVKRFRRNKEVVIARKGDEERKGKLGPLCFTLMTTKPR